MTPAFVTVDNSADGEGDVYVGDAEGKVVSKFTEAGQLIESWDVKGQIDTVVATGTGTLVSGSTRIESVTTTTGVFFEGQEVSGVSIPPGTKIKAVNGGVVEISDPATASGTVSLVAQSIFGRIEGIAVGASGELWVAADNAGSHYVYELDQEGDFVNEWKGQKGEYSPQGIAVDNANELYVVENAEEVQKYRSSGEFLGVVTKSTSGFSSDAVFGIAVDSATGELYVDGNRGSAIEVFAPSCVLSPDGLGPFCAPLTTFASPQLTGGAGLAVDSQLGVVYIVETASGKIESVVPEPPSAPVVEAGSEEVSNVSADSATMEAVISPRSEPSEEPTSYSFQYTTEERFDREGFVGASSAPIPDGRLAAGFEDEHVTAHAQGLAPGTSYRYRVVAENAVSRKEGRPTEGERNEAGEEIVHTFVTQTPSAFGLPDGRAWELVSPSDKRGAQLQGLISGEVAQASAAGDAFTYLASAPTEASPPGNSNYTQVLSTRGALNAVSWGSRDIATPRDVANGFNEGGREEYRFFSTDLSLGVVQPFGAFDPSLSVEASEQTAYLHTDYPSNDPGDPCVSSCYRPLVTGSPGFANVPEGIEFGGRECNGEKPCVPQFLGASSDGSHIALRSNAAGLTEGAPVGSLYEWAGGLLQLVSVLPEGEPAPESSLGSKELNSSSFAVVRNAVSLDGYRVVWSSGKRLYLRDVAREETVEMGGLEAQFQTASEDDSRVFFTAGGDLYEFDAPAGAALTAGHTTDLTPGGNVQGIVPGASQDGSSVYFVATGVLTGEQANDHGEVATGGQPNLYVYHAGVTRLIAVLSREDGPDWKGGGSGHVTTARVSPGGNWLAFMSERPLTGYDNHDASSGELDEEVFLYDAASGASAVRLVCASCNPTGARPHGTFDSSVSVDALLVDSQQAWLGRWLAADVPAWTSPLYQSRYLSDSGRLFFNSSDALVPSDTNGVEDVYEYEPPGVGTCTSESTVFSPRSKGCADLVSSGTAGRESAFLDASENGDDVFLLTPAHLSRTDTDTVLDVYDARVGGGSPESQPPPSCEGDACQSPVAAPNDPTPGSLTYSGPGNPVPLLAVSNAKKKRAIKCAKGKKIVHGKCVKKTKKKARKASKSSRVGRFHNKRGGKS